MAVTFSEQTFGQVKKVVASWVSDASGDATGASTARYSGQVVRFVTVPSTSAAPTDNYDVVLNDSHGLDVLLGTGANRDTANTEQIVAGSTVYGGPLGIIANDTLTLTVSNAGNAKAGTAYVYLR